MDKKRLDVKACALTAGVLWGLGVFLFAWWVMLFEGATGEATLIGLMYRGFEISPLGSVIGLAWGLADGLVGGALFAWLYNFISAPRARAEAAA